MTQEEKARAYDGALERARELIAKWVGKNKDFYVEDYAYIFPELRESEDERIRKALIDGVRQIRCKNGITQEQMIAYLEKQKENPKNDDSIPEDCVSNARCEDRWHKVQDSLPDNGRLVLANDCLGNMLLARYDGEGNWEVSVYDNDDYYCRNTITKWCEIPSEKQKEPKQTDLPAGFYYIDLDGNKYYSKEFRYGDMKVKVGEQKPAWSEEDEKMLKCCLIAINHYEKTCNIGDHLPTKFNIDGYLASIDKVKSWLKSLRPNKQD